ncbi:hypothetical protein NP493_1787g00014 [Ridgeia piscesae]|uniref:Galaxin-like repeats domain-containing protein n=1 Tax=Ridgeia piscesae TaxID=27915 RepID=A0AAD9N869_RIDPI|nr:hypothetical protein NP493_1787g00014 [Ridgeia piscesae]
MISHVDPDSRCCREKGRYCFAKFPLVLLLVGVACLAMTNAFPRYQNLCGGQPMRASVHICCNGRLQDKPYRQPACCGTEAYDAYYYICCGLGDLRRGHNCRN